jgi:glycosyltransferase involved in cell wall biosynthesis
VLDLPIDPARWDAERNEGVYQAVRATPGINVLHVGRLAPNKCVEDVIKSFYFLHRFLEPRSTLWLAGIDTDTELYSFALRRLAANLGLEHSVRFLGCLADEEIRSLYEACSVYLCMSEHEGFCFPIIESMHFGLPVVAYGAGAVPDTMGDGGIVVYEKRHAQIAALISELACDSALRERLVRSGSERVSYFNYERFAARVLQLVSSLGHNREAHAVCSR